MLFASGCTGITLTGPDTYLLVWGNLGRRAVFIYRRRLESVSCWNHWPARSAMGVLIQTICVNQVLRHLFAPRDKPCLQQAAEDHSSGIYAATFHGSDDIVDGDAWRTLERSARCVRKNIKRDDQIGHGRRLRVGTATTSSYTPLRLCGCRATARM